MAYLEPADYSNYGLPDSTTADWVTAATALINSFCRRPDLNITQYTERLRVISGSRTVRLSFCPLAPLGNSSSALISIQGRYAQPRRGEAIDNALMEAACAFSLPGQWKSSIRAQRMSIRIPANSRCHGTFSACLTTRFPSPTLAGLAAIGDDIKSACAQIVRNAQATPALNASKTKIDTMQMQYFSSSLAGRHGEGLVTPLRCEQDGVNDERHGTAQPGRRTANARRCVAAQRRRHARAIGSPGPALAPTNRKSA